MFFKSYRNGNLDPKFCPFVYKDSIHYNVRTRECIAAAVRKIFEKMAHWVQGF